MRILLAGPRGFCAGVNMAVGSLQRALERFGPPVYVYHEIVHNQRVVESFRRCGVVFVNELDAAPEGGLLLYSAHGVSPAVRRHAAQRRLRTIDATCPLVRKVHEEAKRFARQGYSIVLIGHPGHDEVVGTLGEAPERMLLVETVEDVDRLTVADRDKVAYLTQTTLSMDDVSHVVARLRQRFPRIHGPSKEDVCYATQNRQEAVKALLPQADAVVVLGSRNSSNSNRLAEIARAQGRPAYLVDDATQIDPGVFRGDEVVLVTAGASAPGDVIDACLEHFRRRFDAVVEEVTIREESARFPLPVELRTNAADVPPSVFVTPTGLPPTGSFPSFPVS